MRLRHPASGAAMRDMRKAASPRRASKGSRSMSQSAARMARSVSQCVAMRMRSVRVAMVLPAPSGGAAQI